MTAHINHILTKIWWSISKIHISKKLEISKVYSFKKFWISNIHFQVFKKSIFKKKKVCSFKSLYFKKMWNFKNLYFKQICNIKNWFRKWFGFLRFILENFTTSMPESIFLIVSKFPAPRHIHPYWIYIHFGYGTISRTLDPILEIVYKLFQNSHSFCIYNILSKEPFPRTNCTPENRFLPRFSSTKTWKIIKPKKS